MYPESTEAALLEQTLTEQAITDMAELALELWLPLAEKAVLQAAAPPPDPSAAAEPDAQWNYLVDAVVLYGVGLIAADAYDKAYTALTGEPLRVAELALPSLGVDMAGMPTRTALKAAVATILKRRLRINATEVEARVEGIPALREFVSEHVGNVKGRVMDAVARVFKRSRAATEEADTPADAVDEVAAVFDPLDPQWQSAAEEVGRTHATGTLNAALARVAQVAGRSLEIEWVAIIDTHTRLGHEKADGQRQPPGASFDVDGEQLRFPGDPLGDVDNTINCRCRLFAYFTDEARGDLQAGSEPYVFDGAADGLGFLAALSHVSDSMALKEARPMADYRSFTSVLAVIGQPTDDGRMFADNIDLTFREMPLPLMWCKQSSGGHYDAYTVGVIESAGIVGQEVIGKGYLLNTPEAGEAAVQIEHGVTGPSVDLGDVEWELRNEHGQPISEDEWWDNPDMKVISTVLSAKVLAATLVATPAFGQTSISLGEMVDKGDDALVAAAALADVLAATPARPHSTAFADPQFTEPTYPHITDDGVIRGHLAAWNVCHTGIQDACVLAPHSQTDYAWFHTSPPVRLADGGEVKVGRLTVGGGHAGPRLSVGATIAHYDNVGTCFALVHVGEDEHGIWFSGIPAPGADLAQIERGLAAPLSGDWRNVGGNLELVAALSVNTPGFPLVASGATGDEGEALSLVASLGPCPADSDGVTLSAAQVRTIGEELISAWRALERREAEARELITGEVRRQAVAIIEGATHGV